MQSSKYYDTVFHLKKEFTKSSLVLYLSFILVTWSLLQISLTNFFENNDNILMKIPSIYAHDDGGNCNGEVSDDNGDSDVEELSLDKEETQDEDVGQDVPEELTLEDGQDKYVDVPRFVGGDPSGTDITSQLPSVDPQPLPIGLPPLPGGPLPPGDLPPLPGSPLPPGSPIPPGGGPTPPEDLPLAGGLPPDDGHHEDDENEEDDDNEDKDEDNDDKDNS